MARATLLSVPLFLAACTEYSPPKAFNNTPEAVILSHSGGQEVLEGSTESFTGQVSDLNHSQDSLTVTWYANGEVACESTAAESDGSTSCDILIGADTTEVRLDVLDPPGDSDSDRVELIVTPTESPEAEITAPTADGVYYSDQLVTFEGILSDGEDVTTDLVAAWESNLDGELEVEAEPNDDGEVTGFGYLSEGEHAVELHVTDTTGKTGSDSVIIEVGPPNSAPTCGITAPETNSADEEGTTIIFEATVGDVDVSPDWLTVAWSSDKDGDLGESTADSSGGVAFPYADLSVNTHVVTLTVTDEVGATCSDYIIYSVGTPPSCEMSSPTSGDVVNEGDVVSFTATIGDGEDTPTDLTVSWTSNLDGEFSTEGSDSSGIVQFTHSDFSIGTHTIEGRVTDSDDLFDDCEQILLQVNGIPTAPEVALSPDPATTTDDLTVAITADATDADGDPISYTYAWFADGVLSSASTSASLSSADTTRDQTWTVEVTPNDGYTDGPAGNASLTISNTAPEVSFVTISPNPATVNDALSCSYSYSDDDGDADDSTIEWDIDGTVVGTGDTLSTGYVGDSVVTCTVTPNDGTDEGTADSDVIIIDNTAPVLDAVTLSPDPAYEGDTLTCTPGSTSDDDGTTDFTYTTRWTVDGIDPGETTDTLSSDFFDRDQDVVCYVTPNDGTEDGDEVESNTVIIENTAPVLAEVTLSPEPAYEADTLVCSPGTTTDVDGTTSFTYSYTWTVNGSDPGETSSQLTGDDFDRGDTVHCTVTPSDTSDAGDAVDSNTITIDNTAPEVSSVSIDPDPATAEDTLLCGWSFDDDDGDADESTLEWTVNGTSAGTDATLTGAFVYGDTVTCTVTANDGSDTGNTDSTSLTIENTAPVLAEVTLSPDPATETDTLICTAGDTTDADGTTGFDYAYAWTVSGVDIGVTTDTLDGTDFDRDDDVYCTVTPSDGDTDGDAVDSNTVTIENTAPTLVEALISPDPASTSDDLACAGNGDSDIDGDSVSYLYAWFVNGTENAETSASLDSGEFEAGDTVYCTVTPTDGTDEGELAVSDSLTIENTAPEVTAVTLSPSTVYTNDTITASVTSSDEDGDSVGLAYEWYVEGSLVAETGASLDGATYFDKDDEVYVVVTANDGTDDSTAMSSSSIIVSNTAPEAPEVSIVEEMVETESAAYCSSDWEMMIDGQRCIQAFTDAISWDDAADNCADLGGYLVRISSEEEDEFLFDLYDALDPGVGYWGGFSDKASEGNWVWEDGATVTYTNWQSGEPNNAAGAEHCLHVSEPGPHNWNDNFCDGAPHTKGYICQVDAEVDVAFENTLLCTIDTDSIDDDGDDISYTITWEVDGVAYTDATTTYETGDTVPSSDYGGGETWTCTVTPNDGDEDGASASAEYESEGCWEESGESEYCPGTDCLQILEDGYSTGDGSYWLDPFSDGSLVFEAYCDMTTDGGGWTYVARGSNDYTQTDSAYGTEQSDPTESEQWHLSMDAIEALVGDSTPYQSYVTMGENGDSDSADAGQFRVRMEYEAMTFESAMIDYDAWDGSAWIAATSTGDTSHRGPSWVQDSSNLCCEQDSDGEWVNCYEASSSLGQGLWSQGNANQHLRCSTETEIQNGLIMFVRGVIDADGDGYVSDEDCDDGDGTIHPYAGDTYGDGVDSDCDGLDCEADYYGSTYFTVCLDELTWEESRDWCQSAGYDDLATLSDSGEDDFVYTLGEIGPGKPNNIRVGANDMDGDGTWEWSSGLSWSYTNWNTAEGAPFSSGQCGHILDAGHPYAGTWSNTSCSETEEMSFACEAR